MATIKSDGVVGFPLHDLPASVQESILLQTANLLNEAWPRSLNLRKQQLSRSNEGLPFMVAFSKETSSEKSSPPIIIGYAQFNYLDMLHKKNPTAFPKFEIPVVIHSVVILKKERGKGYGRKIMASLEAMIQKKGYQKIYLSTTDQQMFYQRLGYIECDPPISEIKKAPRSIPASSLEVGEEKKVQEEKGDDQKDENRGSIIEEEEKDYSGSNLSCAPAPPPPPPLLNIKPKVEVHTWFYKFLK